MGTGIVIGLIVGWLAGTVLAHHELTAQTIALRRQLAILRPYAPKRLRIGVFDRMMFLCLYRLWPKALDTICVVQPETILRWHRAGFRAWWRWKSRNRGARPKVARELRELIRHMSRENPLWGAPRIHGELLKLGFSIAQSSVAKYMVKRPGGNTQGWKTFLRNHAGEIVAIDMLTVPTLCFEQLYAFVVLGHGRRKILHVEVTHRPTAEWLARQIVEAFPWDAAPAFLVRDNDGTYGNVFRRRLYAMGIRDCPTQPHSPWQNGYVERVIGSIRRECLDRAIVFGPKHLRRLRRAYADYYNNDRTHLSLSKDSPNSRAVERDGAIVSRPILGGLHHRYGRKPTG
jgi:transposase InsO family protein